MEGGAPMNLQPVDHPREGQSIQCCVCHQWKPALECVADLDGTPYVAYYCDAHRPTTGGRHEFVNSDPSQFDSNCSHCGGKHRDAVHYKRPEVQS